MWVILLANCATFLDNCAAVFSYQFNAQVYEIVARAYLRRRFLCITVEFTRLKHLINMKKRTISLFLLMMSTAAIAQNFEWAKSWGSTGYDQYSHIVQDQSGNTYIKGYIDGTIDLDPGPGTYQLTGGFLNTSYLLKLDPNGEFVWAKAIKALFGAIAIDASGNIYLTGKFKGPVDFDPGSGLYNLSSMVGSEDAFIAKLDPGGNFLWAKKMGGPKDDGGQNISIDPDGNIYTTGAFQSSVDFDPSAGQYFLDAEGIKDLYISKFDSNGNFIWAKRINGGPNSSSTTMTGIGIDASGNFYATGWFRDSIDFDPGVDILNLYAAGLADGFVLKLDPSGNLVWAKQIGGINSVCYGFTLSVGVSGKINIFGKYWGDLDFDPGNGILNFPPRTQFIGFMVQLDTLGNLQWARVMSGAGSMNDFTGTTDALGNIYTTGTFEDGTIDLDPGPGVFNLPCSGWQDAFISKLDPSGNFVWGLGIHAPYYEGGYNILVDHSDNVFVSGFFFDPVDLNPGPGTDIFTSNGASDIFLLKLSQTNVGTQEVSSTYPNKIYPNPSNGIFNLEVRPGSHFEVIDMLGRVMLSGQMNEQNLRLDLSKFANGMYFLKLEDHTIHLIKQ